LAGAGHKVAAAALLAEHDRLARWLDLPAADALARLRGDAPRAVPTYLGGHGWTESSLTGYEERRREGLWYVEPNGDVHVGREQPRDGTGTVDREAHRRDAFVHTVSWLSPGSYVVKGRVHFTTSYASGAIVFGHSRRDRDLRLNFHSGDYEYAVGRAQKSRGFHKVSFRLEGLWERDGKMPTTNRAFSTEVEGDDAAFEFEIHVRGPRVAVVVNGGDPQLYAVHDGAPIEGHVGFAMSMGAIRVQAPTVQRLDAGTGDALVGLDFHRQPTVGLDELLQLPTRGLPLDPNGTLVFLVPMHAEAEFVDFTLPRVIPAISKLLSTPHEYPQRWLVAVPKAMAAADREVLLQRLGEVRGAPFELTEHALEAPFSGTYPWVLFVDGLGVLRAAADVADTHFHTRVARWSRLFRPRL
ncbi:MAG: hypothetical protein KDE27_23215, partial [Planctomycetes bacterium]|nr:hypothetical protein [Planctomycetota bacterium]